MNNLTRTLLCGAALCALTTVSAAAKSVDPSNVTAFHAGSVVKKTRMQHGATHVTSTISIWSYVSGTVGSKSMLFPQRICNTTAPVKVKAVKKTIYGKISINETYTSRCVFVEPTYKVIRQSEPGTTDSFPISIMSKFEQNGTKYKGTLNLDYTLVLE